MSRFERFSFFLGKLVSILSLVNDIFPVASLLELSEVPEVVTLHFLKENFGIRTNSIHNQVVIQEIKNLIALIFELILDFGFVLLDEW